MKNKTEICKALSILNSIITDKENGTHIFLKRDEDEDTTSDGSFISWRKRFIVKEFYVAKLKENICLEMLKEDGSTIELESSKRVSMYLESNGWRTNLRGLYRVAGGLRLDLDDIESVTYDAESKKVLIVRWHRGKKITSSIQAA